MAFVRASGWNTIDSQLRAYAEFSYHVTVSTPSHNVHCIYQLCKTVSRRGHGL
jgi:hypothetical protein